MSKEKQISELDCEIRRITQTSIVHRKQYSNFGGYETDIDIPTQNIAKALYDVGYRKQSEGEWIYVHTYMRGRCSICNHQMQYDNQPYCANCGAKMKGGAE